MSASQPANFNVQEFTDAGLPLVGGRLYTYAYGTTTQKNAYTDPAGTVPQTYTADGDGGQYIALNARGELPTPLYLVAGSYDLTLKRAEGSMVWTRKASGVFSMDDLSGADGVLLVGNAVDKRQLALPSGAGLVGFNWTQAYAAGTLGNALFVVKNIRAFGTFVGDGVTDDGAVWLAAAASGANVIDARGVTSKCLSQINVAAGQTWLLEGATISFAGTANRLFSAVSVADWNLVGPFKMLGDLVTNPGETVTSAGVYISDCRRWHIVKPTGINIKGSVIELVPGGSAAPRGEHGTVDSPVGKDCVWGWKDTAGSGSEYCTVLNPRFTGMAAAGAQTQTGNTLFIGGHIVDGFDGVRLQAGANNLHGSFVGTNINHNSNYAIYGVDITNGESFTGCHIYANNSVGGGAIYLKNCNKVVFNGGTMDCWVYNDHGATSGLNYIRNMWCPGDYGDMKLLTTSTGLNELVVMGCVGPGAQMAGITDNTAGTVHVELERQATVTQAIASGVATALLWPSVALDKRSVYAASVFTVPPNEGGIYHFGGNQLFSGTTLNAAASMLEMQVSTGGGGFIAKDAFFPGALNGAGALAVNHDSEMALLAGDQIRLMATITGTGTVTHGGPTYRSWISFKKVA